LLRMINPGMHFIVLKARMVLWKEWWRRNIRVVFTIKAQLSWWRDASKSLAVYHSCPGRLDY
jgi:hypothetical protein